MSNLTEQYLSGLITAEDVLNEAIKPEDSYKDKDGVVHYRKYFKSDDGYTQAKKQALAPVKQKKQASPEAKPQSKIIHPGNPAPNTTLPAKPKKSKDPLDTTFVGVKKKKKKKKVKKVVNQPDDTGPEKPKDKQDGFNPLDAVLDKSNDVKDFGDRLANLGGGY